MSLLGLPLFQTQEMQPVIVPVANPGALPTASGIAVPAGYQVKVPKLWRAYFYGWEKYQADHNLSTGTITDATSNLDASIAKGVVNYFSTTEYLRWRIHGFDVLSTIEKANIKSIGAASDQIIYLRKLTLKDAQTRGVPVAEGRLPGNMSFGQAKTDLALAAQSKSYSDQLENLIVAYNRGPLQKFSLDYQAWYESTAWQTEMQKYYQDKYNALDAAWRNEFAHFWDPLFQELQLALKAAAAAGIILTAGALAPIVGISAGSVQGILTGAVGVAGGANPSTLIAPILQAGNEVGGDVGGDIGSTFGSVPLTLPSVGGGSSGTPPVTAVLPPSTTTVRPVVSNTSGSKATVTTPAPAAKAPTPAASAAVIGGLVLFLILLK